MILPAALCVLLGLQWTDHQVSAAALPGPSIDPETLCCLPKAGVVFKPLENIKTLEACKKICRKTNRRPIEFKNNKFGCLSDAPKYSCATVKSGDACAQCYQMGTCYLMPSVSSIKSTSKTTVSKKALIEKEEKNKKFNEGGSGSRETTLGGFGTSSSQTTGSLDTNLQTANKVLSKKTTKSLETKNHAGKIPGDFGISTDSFFGGVSGGFTGRIGPNGKILTEEEVQVGNKKSHLTTNKHTVNTNQDNFVQDLGLTNPGSSGTFVSKGGTSTVNSERGSRSEGQNEVVKTNRVLLSGTAARGLGGGGGPVELLDQKKVLTGSEHEIRGTSQNQHTNFLQSSSKIGPSGTQETNTIKGNKANRENVLVSIRGTSAGGETVKQVATDVGLNRKETSGLKQQRLIITGTNQKGSINTVQHKGTRCVGQGCTSAMTKRTMGTSSGSSQERRHESSDENKQRSIHARAGEGATIVTKGRKKQHASSIKTSNNRAKQHESYNGVNSAHGVTGMLHGTVHGSATTRSKKSSVALEETMSDEELASLNINGFPSM